MALDRTTPTSGPLSGTNYAAAVAEEVAGLWNGVNLRLNSVAGGPNNYTASVTPTLDTYRPGMEFDFVPNVDNAAGGTNININSRGLVPIKDPDGVDLPAQTLIAGRMTKIIYDGTEFRIPAGLSGERGPTGDPGPAGGAGYNKQLAGDLGVIVADNTSSAAANTSLVNAFFSGKTYWMLLLAAGITTFDGRLVVPATCGIEGVGHIGSVAKFHHTSSEGVRCEGQLHQMRLFAVDATTTRRSAAANPALSGIIVGSHTGVYPNQVVASTFQQDFYQVRVVWQPGHGVIGYGNYINSFFRFIRCEENKCDGFVIEDGGDFFGVDDSDQVQPGIITISHLRTSNNAGIGLRIGYKDTANFSYRVVVDQWECADNAYEPDVCPILQGPVLLGTNPVETTGGSDIVVITQLGGHQAVRGHYVVLEGWGATQNGVTAAEFNGTWRVIERISNIKFSVQIGGTASITGSPVGGTTIQTTHIVCAQGWFSGQNHEVTNSACGDPRFDEVTTSNGTARSSWAVQSGGIYLHNCEKSHFNLRFVHVGYAACMDFDGVADVSDPNSPIPKSKSRGNSFFNWHILNGAGDPTMTYAFYVPRDAIGCTFLGDTHPSATYLMWCNESTTRITKSGRTYRGMETYTHPEFLWETEKVPTTKVIASDAITDADGDQIYVQGEGNILDDLRSVNLAPDGYRLLVINPNAYNITLTEDVGTNFNLNNGASDIILGQWDNALFVAYNSKWNRISNT